MFYAIVGWLEANSADSSPIGPYIVDFACFALSLIIELDGSQHDHPENVEADRVRTAYLKRQGYRVLRFRNHELVDSFDGVLDAIFQALELAKQKAR